VEKIKILRRLITVKQAADESYVTRLAVVRNGISYIKGKWFSEFYDNCSRSITTEIAGIKIALPRKFVSHYVYRDYEPITRAAFIGAVKPGMVVIDVGAHIGFYAMLAAKLLGELGTVHAVEPAEENLEFLRKNIDLNGFDHVEIHPVAAGKIRDCRVFHITGSSDSHGFYAHPNTGTLKTIAVTQLPLDQLVKGKVDLIKIDVEGAEMEVLDGMHEILYQNKRLQLSVEWFPAAMINAGYAPLDLPNRLLDLGFGPVSVLDDCAMKIRSVDEVTNLLSLGLLPKGWYGNLWAERN
jgi:FkbM family methyltransferase